MKTKEEQLVGQALNRQFKRDDACRSWATRSRIATRNPCQKINKVNKTKAKIPENFEAKKVATLPAKKFIYNPEA